MSEGLENCRFKVVACVDRFLPYTMVDTREDPLFFISAYPRVRLMWKIMGRQFLIIAVK